MKKLNLLFVTTGMAILILIGCSKKNAIGKDINSGNNAGTVNILPSPSLINDSITIRGKNLPANVWIEFEDETGNNISEIRKIAQTGNTLKFSLKDATPAISMGKYKIFIKDRSNATVTSVDKYYILDEETFKLTPQITGINTSPYDIGGSEVMKIDGRNFSKTGTIVLVTNKATNTEIQQLKETDIIVDERGASITIKPEIFYKHKELLQDVKRNGSTYIITVKIGENPAFLPSVDIDMENTTYPAIKEIKYTSEGNKEGAKITLEGKDWTTHDIFYKHTLNGAEVQMPSENIIDKNTFYMPKSSFSNSDYYIVVKQEGVSLTAINSNTGGSNFALTPYISSITSSFSGTTTQYPANISDATNKLNLTITGAYLTKPDGTLAFTTKGNEKEIKNPTTTSTTQVVYEDFNQQVAEAGDINIVCENAEANKMRTLRLYTPKINNVSPISITIGAANPTITIEGLGFAPKNMVALVKGTDTSQWIESISSDGNTIALNISNMVPGTYTGLAVKVNNTIAEKYEFIPAPLAIQAGVPHIDVIETIEIIPGAAVKLLLRGTDFSNNTKLVFFTSRQSQDDIARYRDTAYTKRHKLIDSRTIELTLTPVKAALNKPTEAPPLYFNFDTSTTGTPKYAYSTNTKFGCFKNVVLGWGGEFGAQSSVISQSYFTNVANYPGLYLEFLGDNFIVFGGNSNEGELGLKVFDSNNARIPLNSLSSKPLTGGSNVSSNTYVMLRVGNGYVPAVGKATVTYFNNINLADYQLKMSFYISP